MDLQLTDRRVLVTGSTTGIGRAAAARFAREGAIVYVHGRDATRTAEAAEALRGETGNREVHPVHGDLGGAAGADAVIAAVPELDVLVNNAGIFEPKPFVEIPDADWLRLFETNVMSGIRLSRAHLPKMLARNWGRIVFVSSESALQPPPEMLHYGMTKTAQLSVSRGLAELTRGTGVTVNAVLPGPTRSEGVGEFIRALGRARGIDDPAQMEQVFFAEDRPTSLLQRFATVDEIANLIVYVCSGAASATNGAALRADGGVARTIV